MLKNTAYPHAKFTIVVVIRPCSDCRHVDLIDIRFLLKSVFSWPTVHTDFGECPNLIWRTCFTLVASPDFQNKTLFEL